MARLGPRWLFGTAAIFNLGVGLSLILCRPLVVQMLGLDRVAGTNLVTYYLTAGFITLFGYAYIRVALNPDRYRAYVELGLAGKLIAIVVTAAAWASGTAPSTLAALAGGDVAFSLLFIGFLRHTARPLER